MPEKTTIVTAIPYVNSTPHIGTLLTDLAGDITARYFRMRGDDIWLVAGTDENGLKIKEAAEAVAVGHGQTMLKMRETMPCLVLPSGPGET